MFAVFVSDWHKNPLQELRVAEKYLVTMEHGQKLQKCKKSHKDVSILVTVICKVSLVIYSSGPTCGSSKFHIKSVVCYT